MARTQFQDFEVLRVLGEGSFGTVYLARQISLDRQVALKITANRGSEARTLASLEHDHIVQVFSETVDLGRNQRMLCMQYVAGTTLERIISALNERDWHLWSGQTVLDAIDSISQYPAVFHPSALLELPAPGPVTAATMQCPLLLIAMLALLPHVLGSIVNISYNAIQIVDRLSGTQRVAFSQLVLGYDLIVYPFCVWLSPEPATSVGGSRRR
jgi:hypothetical protein